ncbi:MAG: CatB-related O-acetyltransferase [Pseudomonadota bacterium]
MEPDLEYDREWGSIHVGRGTYWDPSAKLITYLPDERIVIGRYCSIAAEVTIATGGEHATGHVSTWPLDNFLNKLANPTRTYWRIPDTIIGSDVWIGHGAHIAGGARVGHGAVVGARTVVMSDVPPYSIVIGSPAQVIRYRFPPDVVSALLQVAWWDWSPEQIRDRVDDFYQGPEHFLQIYGRAFLT